ncbi:hypothetical protein GCWU000325_02484 [Alloprevotella tannerae ATCC 51259]|uniref:Uncharacterized protein n=1 Tax=Alloprevotella tannerae ATCC 51259 TaxID=626522 RepID=C9LJS0_9BACT|nr:hypothetical protein GCWU000325_02484 [Alloprevotella tannerae ATCC 51259]
MHKASFTLPLHRSEFVELTLNNERNVIITSTNKAHTRTASP